MLTVYVASPSDSIFQKIVEKSLKKPYFEAIEAIRTDPFIGQPKTGDLRGLYGYDVFYRGTDYEIAYSVEENEEGELNGRYFSWFKKLKSY